MKNIIAIILSFCSFLTEGVAQSFPNITLSQVPNSCLFNTNSLKIDQFADQSGDGCPSAPWFVSHGTPDIVESTLPASRAVFIGSATKGIDKRSEGVSYRQTFFKDKWYKMSISFRGNTDKFNIVLGNGVPIATAGTITSPRSFALPNVSDKQIVLEESGNSNTFTTKEFVFIPKKDFECLWFYSEDSHESGPRELNELTFMINSLTCDLEPIKEIIATRSTFDYGPRTTPVPYHVSMPPKLSASNRINITPRPFVEIVKVPSQVDPPIKLVAGRSILIKPDNTIARSAFWSREGSIFSASISQETTGCEDACESFIPWNSPNLSFFTKSITTIRLDKCRTEPENTEVRFSTNYPKPFNAYRVRMIVYKRNNGSALLQPIFDKVWEDPFKRALKEGDVVWKPILRFPDGTYIADGVYPVEITMTNCYGDFVHKNAISGSIPDVTIGCGIIKFASDDQESISNSLKTNSFLKGIKNDNKTEVSVEVFPNPTTGKITIRPNADIGKSIVKITNILGINEVNFVNDNISGNNSLEYDISNLPTGIYIVSVISDNKIISRTKINKL
jgi:hypothetical protein